MDNFELIKLQGIPDQSATTQIHTFDLPDGKLFILLSLTSTEQNITRMETIRGVVNFLHHQFSEDFNFETFRNELQKSVSYPPFDMVVFYTKGDAAYAFTLGRVMVYLVRGNAHHLLISGKGELHSVSGKIEKTDLVVIGTESFFKTVEISAIEEYFNKKTLKNLETDFEVSIEQGEDPGHIGGLVYTQTQKADELDEDVLVEPVIDQEQETETEAKEEEPAQGPSTEDLSVPYFEQPKKRFFIRTGGLNEVHGKNKRLTVIGASLLLILSVSIFFGFRAKKNKEEGELVTKTISQAKDLLSEARAISLINKARARELIYTAQQSVLGIQTVQNKYPEVKGMSDEINDSLGEVGGIYKLNTDVFSDLSLITNKMKADEISISDDVVTVLGKEENRVITIALQGKRTETVTGSGSYNNPTRVTSYSGRTFVWEGNGINEYGSKKSSVVPTVSAQDGLVFAFAGNLYVVDKSTNQIWRFSGNDNGFGSQSAWLTEGVNVDLSKSTSMAIDSSIWVLSETGKLSKFTLGNPQTVSLKGIDTPLSESSKLFTNDEQKYLYILDPKQKAVYVFDKNGEFVAKYENDSLENATNLVVSESQKIMVIGAGSKLLSIQLKHLK